MARATDIARSMVKEYGTSSKIGQFYFTREKRVQFLNLGLEGAVEYSEATTELIDNEVREIIGEQYLKSIEILQGNMDTLKKATKLLLDKEKIEGGELKALMDRISPNHRHGGRY